MRTIIVSVSLFVGSVSWAHNHKISKGEYVEMWSNTAVYEMEQYGIPASITLAQGILESASGNSDLAIKANNHFGIKCHTDWDGEKIYKDDDAKNECFRVYKSADESFVDHSQFLKGKKRYEKLFLLERDDYKGWAQGLKEAGYATNPKYPQLLIDIIEDLELQKFDQKNHVFAKKPIKLNKPQVEINSVKNSKPSHEVYGEVERAKYVVAQKGDTYVRIAQEYNLGLWQLRKYNDFGEKKDVIEEGDRIYIQPKRNKSKSQDFVVLKSDLNLYNVSQNEGIKVKKLMKLNKIDSPDQLLKAGEKIILR